MWQRNIVLMDLLVWAMLMTSRAPGPAFQSALKLGDPLPPLTGQALTGKRLDLNATTGDHPTVLILSFSRAGGRDAQNWAQHLSKDLPHVTIYTVIFLESVPGLFRPMAVSSIKGGMPLSMQDRTVVLYRDENLWKHRLKINHESSASVILLGPDRQIKWITTGPFTDALYQALREQIRVSN